MKKEASHAGRSHREIDHTGDLGIEVDAESLGDLFEEAALGMFSLLTDLENIETDKQVEISLTASDRQELLTKWLSELNFLHLTDRLLFGDFRIGNISDWHLEATVFGTAISPDRHTVHTEIKAVTYHDILVERRNDHWYARIIFDI